MRREEARLTRIPVGRSACLACKYQTEDGEIINLDQESLRSDINNGRMYADDDTFPTFTHRFALLLLSFFLSFFLSLLSSIFTFTSLICFIHITMVQPVTTKQ